MCSFYTAKPQPSQIKDLIPVEVSHEKLLPFVFGHSSSFVVYKSNFMTFNGKSQIRSRSEFRARTPALKLHIISHHSCCFSWVRASL